MKQTILQIIKKYPKHYSKILKKYPDILIELNRQFPNKSIGEQIYCYLNGAPGSCSNGNFPKFNTLQKGYWKFCGSKKSCQCAKIDHGEIVSNWFNNNPDLKNMRKEKATATMIARYGCENPMHNNIIKSKFKKTNLEKYGVEYPLQSDEIQDKVKKTNLEKYGVEYPLQSDEIQDKVKKTTLKRYGNLMSHARKGAYDKFNGNNPFHDDIVKTKIKKTMQTKYGVAHAKHIVMDDNYLDLFYNESKFKQFINGKTVAEIYKQLNVSDGSIYRLLVKYDAHYLLDKSNSTLEKEMAVFLDSINVKYQQNYRKLNNVSEVDFYLPEHNLAIEMNGDYWHSSFVRTDRNYHYDKWNNCNKLNIQLIQINESEFCTNKCKYEDLIKSSLNMKSKIIGARKLTIKQILYTDAVDFLNMYHLQNAVSGKYYYGAYYNQQLVAVMVFGNTRNQNFELKRFVCNPNLSLPGVFSRLFKKAQNDIKFKTVKSFSDNRWFKGNMYEKCNFKLKQISSPRYQYFYKGKLWHMQNFTKPKILKRFPEIFTQLDLDQYSEEQLMVRLGIPRIYDAGQKEWVWTNY